MQAFELPRRTKGKQAVAAAAPDEPELLRPRAGVPTPPAIVLEAVEES